MFANGQNFSIEGSELNNVGGNMNVTTYNIHFTESKTESAEAQSQLMDKAKWKELVSNIERLIAKRQEGGEEETEAAGSVICTPSGTMIFLDADHMNAAKKLIPTKNNQ